MTEEIRGMEERPKNLAQNTEEKDQKCKWRGKKNKITNNYIIFLCNKSKKSGAEAIIKSINQKHFEKVL